MLTLIRAFGKSIGFALLVFGIFWLPKDVEDASSAAEPWQRALAMIDQNVALWATVTVLGAWLVWTDVRPFWRARFGPKYPPRHAAILQELAGYLAQLKQIASHPANALDNSSAAISARMREASAAWTPAQALVDQISYDTATAETARDFIQMCFILMDGMMHNEDTGEIKAELNALAGPFFQALHAGSSVNRAALPLPQWTQDTAQRRLR